MRKTNRSDRLNGAMKRYRVMAYTVGVGLLALVFIGVPVQVWGHSTSVVAVVGPIHGYLYLVYLVAAFDLARTARFRLGRLLVMIAAGLVPFLAFIIERRIAAGVVEDEPLSPEIAL